MPNFNQHLRINFVCLSAAEILLQLREQASVPKPQIDWGRFAVNVGFGSVAGAAPDLFEPSLGNPNHRGFFHSLSVAMLVWWVASGRHTDGFSVELRRVLAAVALGYSCHLGADLVLSKAKGMGLVGPDF